MTQAGFSGPFIMKSLSPGYSNNRYVGNLIQSPFISSNNVTTPFAEGVTSTGAIYIPILDVGSLVAGTGNIINNLNPGTGTFETLNVADLTCGTGTFQNILTTEAEIGTGIFTNVLSTYGLFDNLMATNFTIGDLTIDKITANTGIITNLATNTIVNSQSIQTNSLNVTSTGTFLNTITTGNTNMTTASVGSLIGGTGLFYRDLSAPSMSAGTGTFGNLTIFNNFNAASITAGTGTFGNLTIFNNFNAASITAGTGIFGSITAGTGLFTDTVSSLNASRFQNTYVGQVIGGMPGLQASSLSTGASNYMIAQDVGSNQVFVNSPHILNFCSDGIQMAYLDNAGMMFTGNVASLIEEPATDPFNGPFVVYGGLSVGINVNTNLLQTPTGIFSKGFTSPSGVINTLMAGPITSTGLITGKTIRAGNQVGSITTNNYTITANDLNTLILCNSGMMVFLPAEVVLSAPTGTYVSFVQQTAGKVTLAPTGTSSLVSNGGLLSTANQYAVITSQKISPTQWLVYGNLGV